jgi:hypothetical protein
MDILNTIIFHYCVWTTYNVTTIFQHFMNDIFQEFWNEFVILLCQKVTFTIPPMIMNFSHICFSN